MKTQGIDILTHHLKNTIARELNEAYDKEAEIHHQDIEHPTLPEIPNQINVHFHNTHITTKNMGIVQKLQQKNHMKTT